MGSAHYFDRYLTEAASSPRTVQGARKRALANSRMDDVKKAAEEWKAYADRFLPTESDLGALWDWSCLLRLNFTLTRPFTSKTEEEFHPEEQREEHKQMKWFEIQNPIVRDHTTGLPLAKPTTWKGHLRFAARFEDIDNTTIGRLFGAVRDGAEGREGCLRFFPTLFTDHVQREVITPLKRSTRTPARGPIAFEVVSSGSKGTFCLLYVPHPKGDGWSPGQIADDVEAIGKALNAMFLTYGFSAKKSAGWGLAQDELVESWLWAKGAAWPPDVSGGKISVQAPHEAYLPLLDENSVPRAGLRKPDGTWLSNEEFKKLGDRTVSLTVYKKFRAWYEAHGAAWAQQSAQGQSARKDNIRSYPVKSLSSLSELAARLAAALRSRSSNG